MRDTRPAAAVRFTVLVFATALAPSPASAQDSQELAKKLANPVASLISLPIQGNYDSDIGAADEGNRLTVNVQPVIPISLSQNWNLISRTILPITDQEGIFPGSGDQAGLGDVLQSVFFSPKKPTSGGVIWGVGPVVLMPTSSDPLLGTEKWGLGPTVVVLRQSGPWTYGALANHLWSTGGQQTRADVSSTFLQPFLSLTTRTAWTYSLNTESDYDWQTDQWSVPLNASVSKLLRFGKQPVSIAGGVRYWAEGPDGGPEGLGYRLAFTFLFPKG